MKHSDKGAMKGAELKKLREKARMTPTDLGAALGVSSRTVDRWEAGETRITRLAVKAIMAAFATQPEPVRQARAS